MFLDISASIINFTYIITQFLQGSIFGFMSNGLIAIIVYYVLFVWLAKKFALYRIQTTKRAGKTQFWFELINSFWVFAVGALFTVSATVLSSTNWYNFKVYTDLNDHSLGYALFTFAVVWFIADGWFYLTHRLMHHPSVYKYIHAVHHESLDTTPMTSFSFHVVESTIQSLWIYIVAVMFPIPIHALGAMAILGLLNNLKSHMGYEFYPRFMNKWFITSTHHNLHHTKYNGNYGLFFKHWDLLCGTEFEDSDQVFEDIKNRQGNVTIVDNSEYKTVAISKIVKETSDTCSIYFENLPSDYLNFKPGQHLDLKIKIENQTYYRVFSVSSSPVTDKFLRITVKKNTVVSDYFYNHAKIGDKVEILLPTGEFVVETNKANNNNYVMIAGGSGITPLYSMTRSILAEEPKSTVTLMYANKSSNDIIFEKEIKELEKQYPQFKVMHYISGQKRIDAKALGEAISTLDKPICYICGPVGLKQNVINNLKAINISEKDIHQEEFADGYISMFSKFA
jgi:ring-1,2-phenylacetyl-CoA epoxidase subunit PaaE